MPRLFSASRRGKPKEGDLIGKSSKLPKLGSASDARDPLVGGMYGDPFDGTTIGKKISNISKYATQKYLNINISKYTPLNQSSLLYGGKIMINIASVAGPCGAPSGGQPGPSLRSFSPARDRHQKGLTWADPALGLAMVLGCLRGAHKLD